MAQLPGTPTLWYFTQPNYMVWQVTYGNRNLNMCYIRFLQKPSKLFRKYATENKVFSWN